MPDKIKEKDFYYLIKDILACFPNNIESNVTEVMNNHLVSREMMRNIFKEEIKAKTPDYHILAGFLILQNEYLRRFPRSALYEAIDILKELEYCFRKDSRRTIKNLSRETIFRLFVALYFEFIMRPAKLNKGKDYIDKFKESFGVEDLSKILANNPLLRLLFERRGIYLGTGNEMDQGVDNILSKFYFKN